MARTASPLRYPGGKSCLHSLVTSILRANNLGRVPYAEPFAGGGGLALSLLFDGSVDEIHINDIDPGIYSFWHSVLHDTERFIMLVRNANVDVEEWRRQRAIHQQPKSTSLLELGFATFFLNRTNRSGVIKDAGVIGGLMQEGKYKIDCRFNRDNLVRRIERIAKYRDQIHLTKLDALNFIKKVENKLPEDTFLCIDPPYYNKGKGLYTSFYENEDHRRLAECIINLEKRWIVTYDRVKEISDLYIKRRQFEFDVNYSIETKRKATELMIFSKGLRVPAEFEDKLYRRPQYRKVA